MQEHSSELLKTIAIELAEIGVALLMFGVGLHFSIGDLVAVRRIAVPGALGQIVVATALGVLVGWAAGWSLGEGSSSASRSRSPARWCSFEPSNSGIC